MISMTCFARRAFVFSAIVAVHTICFANGSTIRFSGTIVEPACAVSTSNIVYSSDAVRRANQTTTAVRAPLEVGLHCHAAQAVRMSFEQGGREQRAGFDTGVAGVLMTMSRNGKALAPGEVLPLSLAARSQQRVQVDTQLHTSNGDTQQLAQNKIRSTVLVSLNYQ